MLYTAANSPLKKQKETGRVSFRKEFWDRYWGRAIQLKGSLSNDDGDVNNSGKNAVGLISKKTTLHVHQAFGVHFFTVTARVENVNTRQRLSFSFPALRYSLRACLRGGGGSPVGEVTCLGGVEK